MRIKQSDRDFPRANPFAPAVKAHSIAFPADIVTVSGGSAAPVQQASARCLPYTPDNSGIRMSRHERRAMLRKSNLKRIYNKFVK